MQGIKFYEGDSYVVLKRLADEGFRCASCVTDAPYGLTSIVERFGKADAKAAKFGSDGAFARSSAGFMGRTWDGTGIERDVAFWKLVYDVILPGGYIVAFSSARTYHHMAVAIEAAGFITHPMIGWAYASGMPKGHHPKVKGFEGYRHGAQARKPALEPIYVGQKPYAKGDSCKANLLKHGVGPVYIDGIRVGDEVRTYDLKGSENLNKLSRPDGNDDSAARSLGSFGVGAKQVSVGKATVKGRYPANLITDGSEEVYWLFPKDKDGSIGRFFESYRYLCDVCCDTGWTATNYGHGNYEQEDCPQCKGMSGLESPFDGEPLIFNKKADKNDRAGSSHATVKPIALMQSLVRHVTPPGMTVLDPFAGSGTTGIAAAREGRPAILIEAEPAYAMDIRSRLLRPTDAGVSYLRALGMVE